MLSFIRSAARHPPTMARGYTGLTAEQEALLAETARLTAARRRPSSPVAAPGARLGYPSRLCTATERAAMRARLARAEAADAPSPEWFRFARTAGLI